MPLCDAFVTEWFRFFHVCAPFGADAAATIRAVVVVVAAVVCISVADAAAVDAIDGIRSIVGVYC